MCSKVLCILITLSVYNVVSAYNLLVVFPYPGKSHTILGEGYVRLLLKAGHEVTYITPILIKNPSPKLKQIDVSSNFHKFSLDKAFDFKKIIKKEVALKDMNLIYNALHDLANTTIMHENVQKFLLDPNEKFDAVVVEWLYSDLYSGFATVFNCPLIWSSTLEPHSMVLRLIDETLNPAYVPDCISTIEPPFTFWQRLEELWTILEILYVRWFIISKEEECFKEAFGPAVMRRGRALPSYSEVKYNGSLMLGNSHVSSGLAIRLPQNYIPISGYHIDTDIKPLPQNFQKIMDGATHGVIYFSMGTLLKSKTLPNEVKNDLLDMFGALKQTVIWKYEEKLINVPQNVHIVEWAPQLGILAHPNCLLFITHGGLLSTAETLHFGVPIIGIPIFADQSININRAVSKGYAKYVEIGYDLAFKLKEAIEEILGNPRYHEKAKELSLVYHHRVASPGAELVHWVEHVVRTRGAPHLRSPALLVPWYQKIYLDLIVLILAIVFLLIGVLKYFLSLCNKKRSLKRKLN